MSVVAAARSAASGAHSRLDAYRDDGPLAMGLGRTLGPLVPVPAALLTALAGLPLIALLAIDGERVSREALGVAVAWALLAGGVAAGRPDTGRFAWIVPPVLRLLEYGSLLALAAVAEPNAVPACFALVAVLAFHHYDTVYRLRHQGADPPRWLSLAGGGWDGRMVLGYVLLLAGVARPGFFVAAILLGVVYAGESVSSWLRFNRSPRPALYDDDEDEDE